MVFRLPTHLDSFIPPPSAQAHATARTRPWRGTLTVRGMRQSDLGSNQEIRVTAVETDGDNDVHRWPPQFFAQIAHDRPILREVRAWIQQNAPPLSTFMPDRLPDPNANVVNTANFRSLSRILFEQQLVAIAPWGSDTFPGGGLIIIPAEHSSALLVAALFFSQFPDIIATSPTSTRLDYPVATQPHAHPQPQMHNPYAYPPTHAMQPMSGATLSPISPMSARPSTAPSQSHFAFHRPSPPGLHQSPSPVEAHPFAAHAHSLPPISISHYSTGAGPSSASAYRRSPHAHGHSSPSPVDREQPISRFRAAGHGGMYAMTPSPTHTHVAVPAPGVIYTPSPPQAHAAAPWSQGPKEESAAGEDIYASYAQTQYQSPPSG